MRVSFDSPEYMVDSVRMGTLARWSDSGLTSVALGLKCVLPGWFLRDVWYRRCHKAKNTVLFPQSLCLRLRPLADGELSGIL